MKKALYQSLLEETTRHRDEVKDNHDKLGVVIEESQRARSAAAQELSELNNALKALNGAAKVRASTETPAS